MDRSIPLTDKLLDYIQKIGVREHPVLQLCRQETHEHEEFSIMQIAPEQGALLSMLIKMLGARKCIEVGVFTGYSTLNAALALPDDGEVIACELSSDYLGKAARYFEQAGVAHKIRCLAGPATDSLRSLMNKERGQYDFAFIDANKTDYDTYYELCLDLVRTGGVVAIDNVLWGGDVIDDSRTSEELVAIRLLNEKIAADSRVDTCLVGIADGILLCRKR